MLYAVVVHLRALKDAALPATLGHHVYALFLALLREADPELAKQAHDAPGVKPFTVSPLQGPFRPGGKALTVQEGAVYRLRLTFLEDQLFAGFLHALLKRPGQEPLALAQGAFQVDEVITTADRSQWAGCRDFADLLAGARAGQRITLHFASPTTFRSGGNRNVLFPTPALVFGSYLARWNAFSPHPLPPHLTAVCEERVLVARYTLRSRMLAFGRYQEAGFQGVCEFLAHADLPEADLKALDALGQFAFFCGTGAKTAMGMGQTRRLDDAGPVSDGTRRYPAETGRVVRPHQGRRGPQQSTGGQGGAGGGLR